MGAVISFFKMVGMFIISIPQNIVCIFKLVIVGSIYFVVVKTPLIYPVAAIGALYIWWWMVMLKFLTFMLYATVGGLMAVVDVTVGQIAGLKESLGNQVRNAAAVLASCDNDPRAWYRTPQYHHWNKFDRLLGLSLCMSPCSSGFSPSMGALMCGRRPAALPKRCPHAYVTMAYEPYGANNGATGLDKAQNAAEEAELEKYRTACDEVQMTTVQRRLPEAICWQTDAGSPVFAEADVAGMCYEMMCARDNKDSAGQIRPSFCSALVPTGRGADGGGMAILDKLPAIAGVMLAAAVAARMQVKWYRPEPADG